MSIFIRQRLNLNPHSQDLLHLFESLSLRNLDLEDLASQETITYYLIIILIEILVILTHDMW